MHIDNWLFFFNISPFVKISQTSFMFILEAFEHEIQSVQVINDIDPNVNENRSYVANHGIV
jgi:hypothetical protein